MAFVMRIPVRVDGLDSVATEYGIVRAEYAERVLVLAEIERRAAAHIANLIAAAEAVANELVVNAQTETCRLIESAEGKADETRREAYAEGERLAATAWHERQTAIAQTKASQAKVLHEKLAEVVITAVERIVQGEGRAALFKRALKSVQSLAAGSTAITLRVSENDENDATISVAELLKTHRSHQQMNVVVDKTLAPGSCIFESEAGVLDASLQTQLDALRAAMSRAVRRTIESEEQPEAANSIEEPVEHLPHEKTHA
jgi:type III secretion protein L